MGEKAKVYFKAKKVMSETQLRQEVLNAAMRLCDYWGDSEETRQEMRQGISSMPLEHLKSALHSFNEVNKGNEREAM